MEIQTFFAHVCKVVYLKKEHREGLFNGKLRDCLVDRAHDADSLCKSDYDFLIVHQVIV